MNHLNSDMIKQHLNYSDDKRDAKITLFESIDSTNSWLLQNGECGDVCLSETQTAGRGRRGNQWVSPDAGNIYFSLCYCFEEITEHWSLLGLLVGIAVAESLQALGLRDHGVKWPNDIFWNEKKLGGILLESQDQTGRVVIGIGLNVGMQEAGLEQSGISQPWTSLRSGLKTSLPSRNVIIATMMNHLRARLDTFSNLNLEHFLNDWQRWDILLGKRVIIHQNGTKRSGKVTSLDKHGRIGILHEKCNIQYYSSAEIKLVSEKNE